MWCVFMVALVCLHAAGAAADPASPLETNAPVYTIKIHDLPHSHEPEYAIFQALLEDHPQVRYTRHTQLELPNVSRGSLLMAIAGGIAPDILRVFHHEAKAWTRNGFFEPLDEWIYKDLDGDGKLTEGVDEIIWEPWNHIPRALREIMMEDGHIYFVPRYEYIQGIIYRKDLFRQHGLDPEKPIETFDELLRVSQKLTDPTAVIAGARTPAGRKGFCTMPDGWMWQGYLFAAGGEASRTVQLSRAGQVLTPEEAARLHPTNVITAERAAFNDEAGRRALQLWKDLFWAPFVKCPTDGEPISLGGADATLTFPITAACSHCGTTVTIESRADPRLITGSARAAIGEDADWKELFVNGEVAMFSRHKDFLSILESTDIDSRLVGFMPLPEKGGLTSHHFWAVYAETGKREGGRDRVRVCAQYILDYAAQFYVPRDNPHFLKYDKHKVISLTERGFFNFCTRDELIAAGLEEYVAEIPAGSIKIWEELYDPANFALMPANEGYSRIQLQVFGTELLSQLVIDPTYSVADGLKKAEALANSQVYEQEERIDELVRHYRVWFILIIAVFFLYVGFLIYYTLYRGSRDASAPPPTKRLSLGKRAMGFLLLLPAAFLIGLWSYYPLIRGSIMAFQDVRLLSESTFVGFENFVRVITNPQFATMIRATVEYVFAVLALGFITPIILAILLSEIRRFSTAFRVIYYAPHVLGGVVVLFIWKIYYSPAADGFLNQVLAAFRIDDLIHGLNATFNWNIQYPVNWLQNTSINKWMLAFPLVWASMGSGALIYLAALRSFDEEMYEAAEIDGAGSWSKMWHITLASLKPLIIIQFVGAFINAFQGMGNILILTGGAYDTNVIGLQIFLESFAFLRFGNATALAWLLGGFLVSFTIIQLRILKKVEFRRAS
ncbi:MAG TPA: extracellular solute-binding protein [Kiritimatiellia bacterium]|nr:extracellular solute-binding protein [Kiritimatiellia bacterium]